MPAASAATSCCLRATARLSAGRSGSAMMPAKASVCARRNPSAVSSSVVVGMQQWLTQLPPSCASSTIAARPPSSATRTAAAWPAGPAPMATRSNVSSAAVIGSSLFEREQVRLFQQLPNTAEEGRRRRTVEHTMIDREAERHALPRYRSFAVERDRLAYPPHAKNGGLRRIDDRREAIDAVHTQRCDRESATGHVVQTQLSRARPFGQVGRFARHFLERLAVGVAEYRHDQPFIECDSDPDIDLGMDDDPIAF